MTCIVIKRFSGRQSYSQGLKLQEEALELLRRQNSSAVILGLEHDPVITLGVRGNAETDLLLSAEALAREGLEVRHTKRGGQATVHTPGQLVIYPCVDLRAYDMGPKAFVGLMTKTTQVFFRKLGLEATISCDEPGLFIGEKKIAAFGFQVSKGLTSHGLAINVENDLSRFQLIRTCGVTGQPVTRLRDFGVDLSLEDLFSTWCGSLELPSPKNQPINASPSL